MDVNEVLKKYSKKLEKEIGSFDSVGSSFDDARVSKDYYKFKQDMMPELSRYEKIVRNLGSIVKIKLSKKNNENIRKDLEIAHLDIEPGEVAGLAVMSAIFVFVLGLFISLGIFFINGSFPILFLLLMLIACLFLYYYFYSMPSRLAIKWRLKASSQMVPAVLYTVIYMKHTSNLERAIGFVSQHVEAPLALDLKKVLWDVETGKYSTVKESLDKYLDFWKDYNIEFVESFHLIESSLYEPSEQRRVMILEKALKVILDGVYEGMLKYTHSIKSPLTNLYMLGIVLPTLGLALLPLASTLLGGMIKWTHVFVVFNLIIPFFVFYLTLQIMLKRPGGYGETTLLEKNPLYFKYESKQPYYTAAFICVPFLILGLLPLIFGYTGLPQLLGLTDGKVFDPKFTDIGLGFLGDGTLFGYYASSSGVAGPFGIISLLLSLFVPFSIAMFFSLSFSLKTRDIIKSRDDTRVLEKEFSSSLFTLGNRLGDGIPAEVAFAKVADSTKGQKTENFFRIVNSNIQSMGMGLEDAIFNSRRGALVFYPSSLIASSMRILIESVKKGLTVAAQSLMSISEYVKNLQKINERLEDLLADVVSDMKSNMTFLAPLLAGIVIGLSSMITSILGQLKNLVQMGSAENSFFGFGTVGNIVNLFDVVNMIPPYFMQIAIGVYIIQMVFILTTTLVTIDSGEDRLKQTYDISKNLIAGSILYLVAAFFAIVALYILTSIVLVGLGG